MVRGEGTPEIESFPEPPSASRVAVIAVAVIGGLALAGLLLTIGIDGGGTGGRSTVAASRGGDNGPGDAPADSSATSSTTTTEAPVPEPPSSQASIKAPPTVPDRGIGVLDGEELVLIDVAGKVLARAPVGPNVYPHGPGRTWSAVVDQGNLVLDEGRGRLSPARGGFAKDCADAQTAGSITVARCGPADVGQVGGGRIDIDTGDGRGARLLVASPPVAAGTDVVGHWAAALPSPDGAWVLAQWSGECEVPVAFLVEPATGALRTVTGEQGVNWTKAANSVAAGWTADGRAVVALHRQPGCGSGKEAGVYLVQPPAASKVRIFRSKASTPSVFLWSRKVSPKWDQPLSVSSDGVLPVVAFNAFVTAERPGWAATPEGVAAAFTQADRKTGGAAGSEPAPTIAASGRRPDGTTEVTVVFDRVADDSVRTYRYTLVVAPATSTMPATLVSGAATWRCQAGRGHQTFSTEACV